MSDSYEEIIKEAEKEISEAEAEEVKRLYKQQAEKKKRISREIADKEEELKKVIENIEELKENGRLKHKEEIKLCSLSSTNQISSITDFVIGTYHNSSYTEGLKQ